MKKSRNFCRFSKLSPGGERNFIEKTVNRSLRQISKRGLFLNQPASETAEKIKPQNTKSARSITGDALRELRNKKNSGKTFEEIRFASLIFAAKAGYGL